VVLFKPRLAVHDQPREFLRHDAWNPAVSARRARAKDKMRLAFLDKIDGVALKLAAGTLFTMAYLAATSSTLAVELSQDLFDLIP
jgi:hypothetical protein